MSLDLFNSKKVVSRARQEAIISRAVHIREAKESFSFFFSLPSFSFFKQAAQNLSLAMSFVARFFPGEGKRMGKILLLVKKSDDFFFFLFLFFFFGYTCRDIFFEGLEFFRAISFFLIAICWPAWVSPSGSPLHLLDVSFPV